jgi:hypothetical protein
MFRVDDLRREHDKLLAAHSTMVGGALYDAGLVAIAEVVVRPQFKPQTGKLQRGTKTRTVRTSGGKLLRISNATRYARSIEEGARPHKITARNANTLRFYTKGGVVFRRSVNHPGNKPYWFLRKATDVAGTRLERMLVDGMTRVARMKFTR